MAVSYVKLFSRIEGGYGWEGTSEALGQSPPVGPVLSLSPSLVLNVHKDRHPTASLHRVFDHHHGSFSS